MTSKYLVASGVVTATRCTVHTIILTAGSDTATAIFYDDAAAATSGKEIAKLSAVANTSASADLAGRVCFNGLYVATTGTSPAVAACVN